MPEPFAGKFLTGPAADCEFNMVTGLLLKPARLSPVIHRRFAIATTLEISSAPAEFANPKPGPSPSAPATPRGLWAELPMSAGIATLVCYAGVFGDVIGVDEIAARLGAAGSDEFATCLAELRRTGRLIVQDGFAALPNLADKVKLKPGKIVATTELIATRITDIRKLARNPILKFVGISGSLAANNPTRDRNNEVDIDIFLITRRQCLWLYVIPRNLRNLFPRRVVQPNLCINYVMDESSLRITNRNFYTATEIRNLVPVAGKEGYQAFLRANRWMDFYYPGFSGPPGPVPQRTSANWINRSLYVLFSLLQCIKHLSFAPLRYVSFNPSSLSVTNFDRIGQNHGGYQELVHRKFSRLAAQWFPELLGATLIERLFPDELSAGLRQEKGAEACRAIVEKELQYDYSKYA